jgi:hypothetical protein
MHVSECFNEIHIRVKVDACRLSRLNKFFATVTDSMAYEKTEVLPLSPPRPKKRKRQITFVPCVVSVLVPPSTPGHLFFSAGSAPRCHFHGNTKIFENQREDIAAHGAAKIDSHFFRLCSVCCQVAVCKISTNLCVLSPCGSGWGAILSRGTRQCSPTRTFCGQSTWIWTRQSPKINNFRKSLRSHLIDNP